jgi:hypothetical protein
MSRSARSTWMPPTIALSLLSSSNMLSNSSDTVSDLEPNRYQTALAPSTHPYDSKVLSSGSGSTRSDEFLWVSRATLTKSHNN